MARKATPFSVDEIWSKIDTTTWALILSEYRPEAQWRVRGDVVDGLCPYHTETRVGSFAVMPRRKVAVCLSGECRQVEGDPVALLSAVTGLSYGDVIATILVERLGLEISEANRRTLQHDRELSETRRLIAAAAISTLTHAVANPGDPDYAYCHDAVAWLVQRKVSMTEVGRLRIGVLPTLQHLRLRIQDETQFNRAKAYVNARGRETERADLLPSSPRATNPWIGAPLFIWDKAPGVPARFKVRPVGANREAQPIVLGVDDGALGWYGLTTQQHLLGTDGVTYVLVEGEMDQVSWEQHLRAASDRRVVVIAGGGGGVGNLSELRRFGIDAVTVCPDYDLGGVGFVRHILTTSQTVPVRVYNWAAGHWASFHADKLDPDDVITKRHGGPQLTNDVTTRECLITREEWTFHAIRDEIHTLEATCDPDAQAVVKVLERYSGCTIPEGMEIVRQRLVREGVIEPALLSAASKHSSPTESFRASLVAALGGVLSILGHTTQGYDAYSKTQRVTFSLPFGGKTDATCRALIDYVLKQTIYDWVSGAVGVPWFIQTVTVKGGGTTARSIIDQEAQLTKYVVSALQELAAKAPSAAHTKHRGEGLHRITLSGVDHVAFVNGTEVLLARLDDGDLPAWTPLHHPMVGEYVFDGQARALDPYVSLDALQEPPSMGLGELFRAIYAQIRTAWSFSPDPIQHDLTATMLSAYVIYSSVPLLWPTKCQLFLTGPQGSGKTTMLSVLTGRHHPDIRLVWRSLYVDDWTAAGVTQHFASAGYLCVLDEFECGGRANEGDRVSHARNMLATLRGNNLQGVTTLRGGVGGTATMREFNALVAVAGIHPPTEAVDFGRFDIVSTHKDVGRVTAPDRMVFASLGAAGVERLARAVSVEPLRRLGWIWKCAQQVRDDPRRLSCVPEGIEPRFLSTIWPIASVLHACGEDWHAWHDKYLHYKAQQRPTYVQPDYEVLLDDILTTAAIRLPGDRDKPMTALSQVLTNAADTKLLHDTVYGVYVVNLVAPDRQPGVGPQQYVVFHPGMLLTNLLSANGRYRAGSISASSLGRELQQHPKALPAAQHKRYMVKEVVERDTPCPRQNLGSLVVFPITELPINRKHDASGGRDALAAAKGQTDASGVLQ